MNEEKLMAIYMEMTGASEGLARSVIIHLDLYRSPQRLPMLGVEGSLYQAPETLVEPQPAIGTDSASADESLGAGWETLQPSPVPAR